MIQDIKHQAIEKIFGKEAARQIEKMALEHEIDLTQRPVYFKSAGKTCDYCGNDLDGKRKCKTCGAVN